MKDLEKPTKFLELLVVSFKQTQSHKNSGSPAANIMEMLAREVNYSWWLGGFGGNSDY